MKLQAAMDEIAGINQAGKTGTTKVQGGKIYTNVSARVEVLRKHLGLECGIETAPLFPANGGIFMQAWVKDKSGFILGTGHAYATSVSKEKGIEKLETTAVGRALASLGLAGGEYASDVEMNTWQERYEEPSTGIHIEISADDVAPDDWLASKISLIEEYATKPRSTPEGVGKAYDKAIHDPIWAKLTPEQCAEYEETIKQIKFQLKQKETA